MHSDDRGISSIAEAEIAKALTRRGFKLINPHASHPFELEAICVSRERDHLITRTPSYRSPYGGQMVFGLRVSHSMTSALTNRLRRSLTR